MPDVVAPPWDQAERWARAIIALSGAAVALWALVRWPLTVLLKAALLAAIRAVLRDDASRESLARLLRDHGVALGRGRRATPRR